MRRPDIEKFVTSKIKKVMPNRILVLWDEIPGESRRGKLILPTGISGKDKLMVGTAVVVGDDITSLCAGDRVLLPRIMGSPVKLDGLCGLELRHVDETQILGTLVGREEDDDYDFFVEGIYLN